MKSLLSIEKSLLDEDSCSLIEHCLFLKRMLTSSVFTEAVKNIFRQKISKIGTFNMLMSTQYQVHGRNEHL